MIARSSIRTRFVGPTNHRPARIIASDGRTGMDSWRLTVSYDHELNPDANHKAAAQAWMDKFLDTRFDGSLRRPVVHGPGYVYGNDYFWSWDFVEDKTDG